MFPPLKTNLVNINMKRAHATPIVNNTICCIIKVIYDCDQPLNDCKDQDENI